MAGEEQRALERIALAASTQLDLLDSGRKAHPPADMGNLAKTCLDVLLKAISAELAPFAKLPPVGELRSKFAAFEKGAVNVAEHLIELVAGWRCPKCSSNVASGAAVVDLAGGKAKVQLVCGACGTQSPLTAKGEEAFKKWFGHLVSPSWNPAANGFLWQSR